jgi:hypothetical protein
MRVYPFPPPALWTRGCIPFYSQCVCGRKSVSFSTTSRVWTWGCIPFHRQQCGQEVVSLSTVNVCVDVRVYPYPPRAGCEQEGVFLSTKAVWTRSCIPFHSQQCGREGVFLSTVKFSQQCGQSLDMGGVFLSTTMSVDVRVYHFPPHAVWMAAEVGIDTRKSVECPVRYRKAPVPEWDAGCRNTDAGRIGLDANAQLCV